MSLAWLKSTMMADWEKTYSFDDISVDSSAHLYRKKYSCQLLEISNIFFKTHFSSYFLEYGRRDTHFIEHKAIIKVMLENKKK